MELGIALKQRCMLRSSVDIRQEEGKRNIKRVGFSRQPLLKFVKQRELPFVPRRPDMKKVSVSPEQFML
jgi:hypothetical protein